MNTIELPPPEILPPLAANPPRTPTPEPPTIDAQPVAAKPEVDTPATYPVQCSVGVVDDQSKVQMTVSDGKDINYPVTFTPIDARTLGLALLYKAAESEILTQLKTTPNPVA